jgi:ankyrin repeat protein
MDARELPPHPNLEQYKKQAKDLLKAWKAGDPDAMRRLTGRQAERATLALADAQFIIAQEYGFESWPKFAKHIGAITSKDSLVLKFESAADAIITGDVATLEALLRQNPELTRWRSTRRHRGTLLHYVSANGVEDFRQKSPQNAVDVAKALLNAGAEVDATADAYAGWSTTMDLLVSSDHPAKAGIEVPLVETLLDFGAAIDGLNDEGSPLMTALAFRHADAAEALVRRGARVENVVAAAGLGREDLVRNFLDADGNLKANVPLVTVPWLRLPKDPRANLELALVWASMLGRTNVVELLLQNGVDPGAKDNRQFTALHWAAFYDYPDTVDVLLKWNAPLEVENVYGGTVLDQTIWVTAHYRVLPNHPAIIQRLIDAGARIPDGWLRADVEPPLDKRVAAVLRRQR